MASELDPAAALVQAHMQEEMDSDLESTMATMVTEPQGDLRAD